MAFLSRHYGRPLPGNPAPPSTPLSPLHSNIPLLSDGMRIGGGGYHDHSTTSHCHPGPESFTSATQSDFVDAILFSVYVSAGGVSIAIESHRTWFPRLATTTAQHPRRSHSVSPTTAASHRGTGAIGTSVQPQQPCPRTHWSITSRCTMSLGSYFTNPKERRLRRNKGALSADNLTGSCTWCTAKRAPPLTGPQHQHQRGVP